jgi:hypothetical protein
MADLSFLDGRGEDFGFLGTLSAHVAIVLVPVTDHGPGRARLWVFCQARPIWNQSCEWYRGTRFAHRPGIVGFAGC